MSTEDYDDELRGALFVNEKKTPGSKQPDREGYLVVGGNRLELAGWLRTSSKTGKPFLSLKAQFPRQQGTGGGAAPTQAAPVQAPPVVQPTADEDIPF